ncbi:hypothetical protein RV18_GL001120 [Enterococcus termitis]|nr:hypothetical protein RV18_GL001120 [Enterococcus termitis]
MPVPFLVIFEKKFRFINNLSFILEILFQNIYNESELERRR